jgi:hypothetical protein
MKMSNKAVKFIIELDYDLASLRFMTGREITEEQFIEEAEEQAVYDLMDLMRSNSISDFSVVKEYEIE